MPKKILITSSYFSPYLSGLTLYPWRLAKAWKKAGYEVSVLTFQHDPKLPQYEVIEDIIIRRLPVHLRISKGLINFFYPFHVLFELRQADVLMVNLPGPEGLDAALMAKLTHKPIIALYHCDVDLAKDPFSVLISKVTNLFSRLTVQLANNIVSSSRDYAAASKVLKGLDAKIHFAYPPLDIAQPDRSFSRELKSWYGKNAPVVGFVGRFSSEKNLETLIEALELLKQKYPKIKLLCVGPFAFQVVGESKYYLKILRMLEEYDVRYEILGVIDNTKLTSFLSFIDLLVLPSNNRTEAFGMVQAEAMILGTPVVAPNSPGIRVPVEKTKMGKLFSKNNSQSLALAITEVYENKLKLQKLQPRAEKYFAKSNFLLPKLKQLTQSTQA